MINNNRWFIAGTVILIGGLILEIFLLVYPWSDLTYKASLGEAINGMTAPLIGIVGAVLIYISFIEQVKTNKFQFQSLHEQRELELLYRLYEELKYDLNALQPYYGGRYGQTDILTDFFNKVLDDSHASSPYPDLTKYLDYIFKQFSFISMRVCTNQVLSNTEKVYLIEKIRQMFNLYFEAHYSKIVEGEWKSRFSLSFQESLKWAGQAIINLNTLSIEILKDRYKKEKNN